MLDTSRCKKTVYPNDRWGCFHPHQCNKKIWKDDFCKIHHPDTEKLREEEKKKRWDIKRNQSAEYRLGEAIKIINTLRKENEDLKKALEGK